MIRRQPLCLPGTRRVAGLLSGISILAILGAGALDGLAADAPVPPAATAAATPGLATGFTWSAADLAKPADDKSMIQLVEDTSAETTREVKGDDGKMTRQNVALEAKVSRRSIAKESINLAMSPALKLEALRPGVYRVSARVKYDGDSNVIGTPIALRVLRQFKRNPTSQPVLEVEAEQKWYAQDLPAPGEWGEISFLYEVDGTMSTPAYWKYGTSRGGWRVNEAVSQRLEARTPRHAWHPQEWLTDAYPDFKADAPDPLPLPPTIAGLIFAVQLPRTKLQVGPGLPSNSLRSATLDWLKIERITPTPGLTVRYARADKRWIRPGEVQKFDVQVENFQETAQTRELVVTLITGRDTQTELLRRSLTLEPGAKETLTLDWPTTATTPIWGWEVRAESRNGATVESSSRDVFSVSPRVYDVHIMGGNSRAYDPYRETENYQNLVEVFGASPGDASGVLPEGEQWLSGMSVIAQTYPIVHATTDYNRSIGVATHMYLFAGGSGSRVMDLYIKHPEYINGRIVATDDMYAVRTATEKLVREHDYAKEGVFSLPNTPHVEVGLNQWFPALLDKLIADTPTFLDKTGYDGIRFDVGLFGPGSTYTVFGEPNGYKAEDAKAHATENWKKFDAAMRAHMPLIEYGANMDSYQYLDHVGVRDVTPAPPEQYPEFIAFCQSHGMLMDEGTMNAPLFNHYMNRFEDALWSICQKREVTRRFGGVYQLFSPHRDGAGYYAHDDIYWAIMSIASGSYYVGRYSAAPYCEDSPAYFITRYSEYFRSHDLVPIPEAVDAIYVDSNDPVWYADTAVQADLDATHRRYVIPLINPPVIDRMRRNKTGELPPPITTPFAVDVKVPEGYKTATAWMLTWEPRSEMVPLEIKMKDGGATASVQFPGLNLFRTLVMEFAK